MLMLVSRKTLALNLKTCTRCIGGAKSGGIMVCRVDGAQVVERATTGAGCPEGLLITNAPPGTPSAPVQIGGTWGPAMWRRLHTEDMDEPKLMAWSRQLPCGSCAVDLTALLKERPPIYIDGKLDWEWGWWLHNAVNAKLGKPEMGFAEARARWVG